VKVMVVKGLGIMKRSQELRCQAEAGWAWKAPSHLASVMRASWMGPDLAMRAGPLGPSAVKAQMRLAA